MGLFSDAATIRVVANERRIVCVQCGGRTFNTVAALNDHRTSVHSAAGVALAQARKAAKAQVKRDRAAQREQARLDAIESQKRAEQRERERKALRASLSAREEMLLEALLDARSHLDYTGYGDAWERECADAQKLPEKINAAIAAAGGE